MLQRPIISAVYGPDAYANGLRIVGKQGQLTDGRQLSGGWNFVLGLGSFLCALPPAIALIVLLKAMDLFPERDPQSTVKLTGAQRAKTKNR